MTNILEEHGIFWWEGELPDNKDTIPTRHVTGLLKISKTGDISLDLDNFLYPEKDVPKELVMNPSKKSLNKKAILGMLSSCNKYVYLSDLWGGFLYQKFSANDCLIGNYAFPCHIEGHAISEISIHLDGYENWLCLNPVELHHADDLVSFTYKVPKENAYKTPSADLLFTYHPSYSYGANATLNPTANIRYTPKTSLSLKQSARKFRLIEDLFIVLTNSEHCMKWPILKLTQNGKDYTHYFHRNMNEKVGPKRHESPTNFELLQHSFGEVFTLWERKAEDLGSAFYSYLATKRGLTLYIEDHFKTLVTGLEAFHRKSFPPATMNCKKQKQIQNILTKLSSNERRLVQWVLKHAHISEPPLQIRLSEVLKSARLDFEEKRIKAFTESCAKHRNDLSHYAGQKDSNDNTTFYQQLIYETNALSYLYHTIILLEIGIKQEIVDKWFKKGLYSNQIIRAMTDAGLVEEEKEISSSAYKQGIDDQET